MRLTGDPAVLALWWIALGLTVLVIVPLTIFLLHRLLVAARSIRRFTAETLEAGVGIAGHTAGITALDETISTAVPIVEKVGRLKKGARTLEGALRERAGR